MQAYAEWVPVRGLRHDRLDLAGCHRTLRFGDLATLVGGWVGGAGGWGRVGKRVSEYASRRADELAGATRPPPLPSHGPARPPPPTCLPQMLVENRIAFRDEPVDLPSTRFYAETAKKAVGEWDEGAIMEARRELLAELGDESRRMIGGWGCAWGEGGEGRGVHVPRRVRA